MTWVLTWVESTHNPKMQVRPNITNKRWNSQLNQALGTYNKTKSITYYLG